MGGNITKKNSDEDEESKTFLSLLDYSQLLYHPLCQSWDPLHHISYQAANFLLLVSSMSSNSQLMRIMMALSFSILTLWGWSVSCSVDTTAWNLLLTITNITWCVWRGRSVTLTRDMEALFAQMFKPLRISRKQFQV